MEERKYNKIGAQKGDFYILILIIHLWYFGVILSSQIFVGIPFEFEFWKEIAVMNTLRSHKTPNSVVKLVSINCNNQEAYRGCTNICSVAGRLPYNVVQSIILNGKERIFTSAWKVMDALLTKIKKWSKGSDTLTRYTVHWTIITNSDFWVGF